MLKRLSASIAVAGLLFSLMAMPMFAQEKMSGPGKSKTATKEKTTSRSSSKDKQTTAESADTKPKKGKKHSKKAKMADSSMTDNQKKP